MRDIDLQERRWLRNFSYEDSNGEQVDIKEGDPIGRTMRAWAEALLQFEEPERENIL